MENIKKFVHIKEFVAEFIGEVFKSIKMKILTNAILGTFILVVIAKSSALNLLALQSSGAN